MRLTNWLAGWARPRLLSRRWIRRTQRHGEIASSVEKLEERIVLNVSAPAILQMFESTYSNVEDRAADIFLSGYGGVWMPPTG